MILLAACASRPPPDDETASEIFRELYVLYHDYLLTVEADDLAVLLDAENRLTQEQQAKLLEMSERGAARAAADVKAEPESARRHLLLALHLTAGGLFKSKLSSLIEGRPSRIQHAYTESIGLDREHAAAAALRLKGKYLMSAPWPIRDYRGAGRALEEAARIGDVPQVHLFLGDLHFLQGKRAQALTEWKRALRAKSHAETGFVDDRIRELARRRLHLAR